MKKKWLVAVLAGVLGLVVVLGAGCGSNTTTPTTPKTTPKTTPSTSPSGAKSVKIVDFAFEPSSMTVPVGTTVTWTNSGAVAHTVTSDTGAFGSGQLQPGATYQFTFSAPGTFPYHCSNHPTQMLATITVGTGTTGGGTSTSPKPVNPTPTPAY